MKVTTLGVITAMKNLGFWLMSTWLLIDIQVNFMGFVYALLLYVLIVIPSDLYLLNHATESAKKAKVT